MNLKEPKKKKHVRLQPQPSLPIDTNENGDWRIYTAHLSASGTCIVDPVEMEAVYSMGFFGKGSLSRSFPSFGRRRYGVPPIARNRQWIRRQKWLEELQSLNENNDLENSGDLERMIGNRLDENLPRELGDDESQASTSKTTNEGEESMLDSTEKISVKESESIPEEPCNKKLKVADPASLEKAAEINNTESQSEIEKPDGNQKDVNVIDGELRKNDENHESNSVIFDDSIKLDEHHKNTSFVGSDESVIVEENLKNTSSVICDESVKIDENHKNTSVISDESVRVDENHKNTSVICDESVKIDENQKNDDSIKVDEVILDSTEDEEICEIVDKDSSDEKDVYFLNEEEKSDDNFKYGDTSDTLMEEETNPYEVLVLPDTDSDTENYLTNIKSRIKKEGFPINETLHLTFEESFFLMYGLGCLQLIHYDGSIFSISNAWNHFQLQDKNFIQKYVVYHYFRSKGWVVKPGLKFGGDFLLYKQGPPFYHASYIVIIEVVDADTLLRDDVKSMRKVTWKNLTGLERLSETIAKEILFAQILWPSSIPHNGSQLSVDSLSEFTVRELLWRRWDPKRKQDIVSTDDENSDST